MTSPFKLGYRYYVYEYARLAYQGDSTLMAFLYRILQRFDSGKYYVRESTAEEIQRGRELYD